MVEQNSAVPRFISRTKENRIHTHQSKYLTSAFFKLQLPSDRWI